MHHIGIDKTICKGCGLCIVVCPVKALTAGTERNAMGYLVPAASDKTCRGCDTCAMTCPDMAITVEKTS